jgi:hypothetical protein
MNEAAGRVMTRMGPRYQRFTLMLTMAEEQATVRVEKFESPDAPDPRMQKCIFLSLLSMLSQIVCREKQKRTVSAADVDRGDVLVTNRKHQQAGHSLAPGHFRISSQS